MNAKPFFTLPPNSIQTPTKTDITSECMQALRTTPKERTENDLKRIMELIGNFPLLIQAPMYVKREICRLGSYMKLEENSVLHQIGEPADAIYILLKGLLHEKTAKDSYGEYEGNTYAVSDGAIIGEQMVLMSKFYGTTSVAKKECEFLKISAEDYTFIRNTHEIDVHEKIEVLTNISVFKMFDTAELTPLCDALLLKRYIPNKVIMEQGSEPTGVFFIKSGRCKMVKEMEVKLANLPKPTTPVKPPTPTQTKRSPQNLRKSTEPPPPTPPPPGPVQSSSLSNITPNTIIHPFLASRLDPNSIAKAPKPPSSSGTRSSSPSKPSSPKTSRRPSTGKSTPSSISDTSPSNSSTSLIPDNASPDATPSLASTLNNTSISSYADLTPPKSAADTTRSKLHKTETEKKFLEVGPLMPYEYFGERAIIENRSGVEMTVLSENHVELYFLPKIDFHRYINSKTISLMKKYAANYPSDKDILAQYYKQQDWERYKTNLVQDILNEKATRNSGSMFSRTR